MYSKNGIYITADIAKAELFDQIPTHNKEFWFALLCKCGGLFDRVMVVNESVSKPPTNIVYRWYPHTLFTMLVEVSGVFYDTFFWVVISQKLNFYIFREPGKLSTRKK